MMPAAVAGGWQFWACCRVVCRDGVPCGRPAAAWPSGWARRRCLSHGGRDTWYPAGRNRWAVARIGGPKVTPARSHTRVRSEREKLRSREYKRRVRAKERAKKAAARLLGDAF